MSETKLREKAGSLIIGISKSQKELEATIEAIYRLEHNFPKSQKVNLTWKQMARELGFVI